MKTLTVAGQEYEKRDLSWYRYLPLSGRWMLELNTSHLLNALAKANDRIADLEAGNRHGSKRMTLKEIEGEAHSV